MVVKAQHTETYRVLQRWLRQWRKQAGLTQRGLGVRMRKPQSWVHNCETGNRRVDVTEFVAWTKACRVSPRTAFGRLLAELAK